MAEQRKSPEAWVDAAQSMLAHRGVDRVGVEPLARDLGVTKGSFYWHFRNRAELLEAVLARWERTATFGIIDEVEAGGDDPATRLVRLKELTLDRFAGELEFAIRDWARRDPAVAERVDAIDRARMGYLRKLLRELGHDPIGIETRALLMYSLLVGDFFIAPSGRFGRPRVLAECFSLLTAPPG